MKLKSYQIRIVLKNKKPVSDEASSSTETSSNSSGEAIAKTMVLPLNGKYDDLGEIVLEKEGMDLGNRTDIKSAECNVIDNIAMPTSIYDLNLLAGELKNMNQDEIDVFRAYVAAHQITDSIDLLNVVLATPELTAFASQSAIKELVKEIPGEDLARYWDEMKHRDFDYYVQFHSESMKGTLNDEASQSLFLLLTYEVSKHNREEIYQIFSPSENDNLWTFKKAEENLEGDYDNIDGRIGNNDVKNLNTLQSENYAKQLEMSVEGYAYDGDGSIENEVNQKIPFSVNGMMARQSIVDVAYCQQSNDVVNYENHSQERQIDERVIDGKPQT